MQNKTFISLAILLTAWVVLAAQLHPSNGTHWPLFHNDIASNSVDFVGAPSPELTSSYKGQITRHLILQRQEPRAEQWSPESLYLLNDALTERISFI